MSTPKKIADPESAARKRRLWMFLAGAGLGWAWELLAGTLLYDELKPLGCIFVLLSALAGGLAALAGTAGDVDWWRRLRIALGALALGLILLLGLYLGFARRVNYDGGSAVFLVGPSRSEHCECTTDDDVLCIQQITLNPSVVHSCWNGVWAVKLALALSYLLTLGSTGMVAGLLMLSARPRAPWPPQGYLDFDIWIDQKSENLYRAKAWSGTAGYDAKETFSLPAFLAGGELCHAGGGPLRGRPGMAVDGASLQKTGDELFRAVFKGELLEAFHGCLAKARSGPGLRIRLRLNDVPHLAGLPWEYLYDGRDFLALYPHTSVVRYLELNKPLDKLQVEPPLRVLAVVSTPLDYHELDEADEEWRRISAALEPLHQSDLIKIERLKRPTLAALEERLRSDQPVHVFHFVGHGGFSELRGDGMLVFEDEDRNGVPVEGQRLTYLFQNHPSLRLAMLNACNSASSSEANAFAGAAQALAQRGVQAVIAMQAKIMDETARSFAEKFYRALAAGQPVDACVSEARQILHADHSPEWGTPVLYLRAADGRLFDGLNPAHEPEIYPA